MNLTPKRLSTKLIIPLLLVIVVSLALVFVLLKQHLKESTVKLNTAFLVQETKSLSHFCEKAVGEMVATNIFGDPEQAASIQELTLSTIESFLLSEGLDGFILHESSILFSTINLPKTPLLDEAKGTILIQTRDGDYHGYYQHFPAWRWYLVTLMPDKQYWEPLRGAYSLIWATGLIFCALIVTAYFLLRINLINPIAAILGDLERDERISHHTGIEELDTLSNTINHSIASVARSNSLLAESETKLLNFLQHSTEFAFITTDIDFQVDLFNPKAEDLLKMSAKQACGQSVIEIIPFPAQDQLKPDDLKHSLKDQLYEQGKIEFEWKQKDYMNQDQWMHSILTPMVDTAGDHCGSILTTRDITDKILKERQEEEVKSRLRRAEKMEVVGLMAGGVAHDLNNILSGVVSYPELLLLQLPEDSPLRKPLLTIQESGKRAADIVSDLLTIARGVATDQKTGNLNILTREHLDSLEHQKLDSRHKTIWVELNLAPDLLNISCSPIHIKKCLMNLITNAFEAIGDTGRILISTYNQYVDKPLVGNQYVKKGEYAILSVVNDGPGIPEKNINHIFEPFYTKKVMGQSGTGLGLAIVWNTVHDHEGGITVTSDRNGTEFKLYFPASRKRLIDTDQQFNYDDLQGNGESILVVDDDKQQRQIGCEMLRMLNYQADSLASGEVAVKYLHDHTVDLLILDMIMDPGMNGRQTYREITKTHPGQKALIVSGFSENEEVKQAQEMGAGSFLKKPYSITEIGLAVKKELE